MLNRGIVPGSALGILLKGFCGSQMLSQSYCPCEVLIDFLCTNEKCLTQNMSISFFGVKESLLGTIYVCCTLSKQKVNMRDGAALWAVSWCAILCVTA